MSYTHNFCIDILLKCKIIKVLSNIISVINILLNNYFTIKYTLNVSNKLTLTLTVQQT